MRSSCRALGFFALTCLVNGGPALAGGVAVLSTVVSDNGDHDAFGDSRETLQLRLLVQNTSGGALDGVVLGLAVGPGRGLACVTDGTLSVGSLAAGETRLTEESFELVVGDLDRTGLGLGSVDAFSQELRVSVLSPSDVIVDPPEMALDLDLDVSGGGAATTFLESFEDGLGAFEIENLDQGRSSLPASDGFRCQYYDPDSPNDNNQNIPPDAFNGSDFCYMGVTSLHADAVFWGLSGPAFSPLGGRGFSGFNSLFFGIDMGPPEQFTTPMAVMEAVRMSEPIHLGWNGVSPVLSIKHQISFADDRTVANPQPPPEALDRGVVLVQLADSAGNAAGPWIKLHASHNPYDIEAANNFFGCMFDPVDDGNDEDDYFNPLDPLRRYGPSSSCNPARVYAFIGETSEPFEADSVGRSDGPGLPGMWGIGTWVESRFDLSRFRGRSIRVRFLASMIKYGPDEDWEEFFGHNPNPGDDGWWIDDVTVSGALSAAAALANDITDNSGLPVPADGDGDAVYDACDNCGVASNLDQADSDADGVGDMCDSCPAEPGVDADLDSVCAADNCPFAANLDQANADGDPAGAACDCNDANAATYPGAVEVNDGADNHCAGDAGFGASDEVEGPVGFSPEDLNRFSWTAQAGASRYQVARAASGDFTQGCTNLGLTTQTFIVDGAAVPPGQVRYYLVRARLPNLGSWGLDSSGVERTIPCAP